MHTRAVHTRVVHKGVVHTRVMHTRVVAVLMADGPLSWQEYAHFVQELRLRCESTAAVSSSRGTTHNLQALL